MNQSTKQLIPAIPIILGCSGHVDIYEKDREKKETRETLKHTVEGLLKAYLDKYPDSPIVVATGLAMGADQIAYDAAKSLADHYPERVGIIAILPMPVATYATVDHFADPANAEARQCMVEAVELLKKPHPYNRVIELPDPARGPDGMPMRDALDTCYANLGRWLAGHCHAIIALWNGDDSESLTGGTTWVIRKAIGMDSATPSQAEADSWQLPQDTCPVHVVATPRARPEKQPKIEGSSGARRPLGWLPNKGQDNAWRPGDLRLLHPAPVTCPMKGPSLVTAAGKAQGKRPQLQGGHWDLLREMTKFNGNIRKFTYSEIPPSMPGKGSQSAGMLVKVWRNLKWGNSKLAVNRATCQKYLCPLADPRAIIDREQPFAFKIAGAADAVAQACQKRYRFWTVRLMILGFLVWVAMQCYQSVLGSESARISFIIFILLAITAVWSWWWIFRRDRIEDRFLDSRHLAEALRVQLWWRHVGITEQIQDHLHWPMGDGIDWIRQALRAVRAYESQIPVRCEDQQERIRHGRESWIADQEEYFLGKSGKSGKAEKHKRSYERCAKVAVCFGIAGFATLVITNPWFGIPEIPAGWVFTAGGGLIAIAALVELWANLQAYAAQAVNYEHTGVVFRKGGKTIDTQVELHPERAQKILADLGRMALREQTTWLTTHRERRVDPPSLG